MDYSTFTETRNHAYEYVKNLKGIVVMKAHNAYERPGTDYDHPQFPESNFFYLTGCDDIDAWFVWDLADNTSHLFFSIPPVSTKMWMKVEDFEDKKKYLVDGHHKIEELPDFVNGLVSKGKVPVHILKITKEEEVRAACKLEASVPIENEELIYQLGEARVRKTPKELVIMRRACKDTSNAHIEVMKRVKPGMQETDVEALWYFYAVRNSGSYGFFLAFLPIVSFGPDSAILHHYAEDNVVSTPDQNCLLDAATTWGYYSSDITRTFPMSGKFDENRKFVYETVLMAQEAVIAMMKPGVMWSDCHKKSLLVIAERLIQEGVIKGPKGEKITPEFAVEKDIVAPFMPHGLGHMLGIDTHDVGGYHRGGPKPSEKPSFDRLRANRLLEPGMVITVEPGCYFNPNVINPYLKEHPEVKDYIDLEKIQNIFYPIGGVRIEDDVLVTENGCEVLTCVPKTVKDIEELMASGKDLPSLF